ncbi:thymidylate synthase [Vibrio phage 1.244.A._10N.261.54.C3]|nr:thymidylate synthase [Vibrio phage 1.244.A._10N.261.54.C3]AUR98803.1 thymidylate synthase [Vibrio phage 1.255.O._10N.286.45.F1]
MKAGVPEIIKHAGGTIIQSDSANRLVYNMMCGVLGQGNQAGSRNGGATDLKNVEWTLTDPRRRHLHLEGRSSNIFQLIAESFWVMSKKGDINPFLKFFIPRAPEYSDDGETWRGAYGPRIYANDQLNGVIERFKKDKLTRQAVVDIYQSELDSPSSIRDVYGLESSKDTPCNDFILFWVDHDDTFHMKTIQRSGDVVFGAGSINVFEFSFMHEAMYEQVKVIYPELKLGMYHHNTVNLHIYDFTREQCMAVIDKEKQQRFGGDVGAYAETINCSFPVGVDAMQRFFATLVEGWEKQIAGEISGQEAGMLVKDVFDTFGVSTMSNQLFTYACLVTAYIWSKVDPATMTEPYRIYGSDYDTGAELLHAINKSKFRKFELEITW